FDDQNDANADTYALTGTSVGRIPAFVAYSGLAAVNVNTGSGADTVDITDTATAAMTVNLGGGGNTVNLTTGTAMLSSIQAPLTVNGGAGSDSMFFDDMKDGSNLSYTFQAGSLAVTGLPNPITFSAIDALTLDTTTGTASVPVEST